MRIAEFTYAVLIFTTLGLGSSIGQEMTFASVADFNAMSARMADYEARLAANEMNAAAPVVSCFGCATDPGFAFEAELLFLKPFQSEGEAPGFDYQPAHRVSLGWTGGNGLGVRVRWFDYHNRNLNNVGVPPLIEDFDLSVVDFEVTDKFQLGHWEGLLSGGVRFADYEELGFFDGDQMDDSLGPVIGVQLNRQVTERLAMFALARDSFQFAPRGLDNGTPMEDMTFNIAEVQLGVQWTTCRDKGGNWLIRGAFESQYWSGGVIGDGDTEDMGLVGGTFAVGVTR
ncbi:MAG: hypothetical protein H8E66_27035 [Planctomycetes bacterium]|nr:hypothetical protein [Planctomycetota bacterium]